MNWRPLPFSVQFGRFFSNRLTSVSKGEKIMGFYSNYWDTQPAMNVNDFHYSHTNFNVLHNAANAWASFYVKELGEFKVTASSLTKDSDMIAQMEEQFNRVEEMTYMASKIHKAIINFLCAGEVNIAFLKDDYGNNYHHKMQILQNRDVLVDEASREPDMSDAMWALRRCWMDKTSVRDWLVAYGRTYSDKGAARKMTKEEALTAVQQGLNLSVNPNFMREPIFRQTPTNPYSDLDFRDETYLSQEEKMALSDDKVPVFYVYKRESVGVVDMFWYEGRRIQFDPEHPVHSKLSPTLHQVPAQKIYQEVYVGDQIVLRTESPYGQQFLAPWVRFTYDFDERTATPYGLGSIMAPYQEAINREMNSMLSFIRSKRFAVSMDAVMFDADNPKESIQEIMEMIQRPGGILPVDTSVTNNRVEDAVKPIDNDTIQSQMGALQLMTGMVQQISPPATKGQVERLSSSVAIDAATDAASSPLRVGIDRFRYCFDQFGRLMMNNMIRFDFNQMAPQLALSAKRDEYDQRKEVMGGKQIDNSWLPWMLGISMIAVPHTRSDKEENYNVILDAAVKSGDKKLLLLMIMSNPYMRTETKKVIQQMYEGPDPEQVQAQAIQQESALKQEQMAAQIKKITEQTKSEEPKRDLTDAKTDEIRQKIAGGGDQQDDSYSDNISSLMN